MGSLDVWDLGLVGTVRIGKGSINLETAKSDWKMYVEIAGAKHVHPTGLRGQSTILQINTADST